MKTCQLCQSVFTDDYVYCLNDGTKLNDASGEQETVISPRVQFTSPGDQQPNDSTFCELCGKENKAGSTFCKQCGSALSVGFPNLQPGPHQPIEVSGFGNVPFNDSFGESSSNLGQTITFSPQPPVQSSQSAAPEESNRNVIIGIVAGVGIIAVIALLLSFSSTPRQADSSSSPTPKSSPSAEQAAKLPKNFEKQYEGTIGGKTFVMKLTRSGDDLNGTASTNRTDYVYGTIDDDGIFRLEGRENDQEITGKYKGRIDADGTISGTWTTPQGSKATSFSLNEQ